MTADKYSAVWVSHSSIGDFLECPRAYFLKNVYRDPKTGHKIQFITPPLALGQAVHDTLESLSVLATDKRFETPLLDRYEQSWEKVSGEKGGFFDKDTEMKYKKRGEEMIRRVKENPGPISRMAVKINEELPHFWLSEEDNIILCGKIDWLEYLPDTDSVNIIDFKTNKGSEKEESLQLPIYYLLVHHCQRRNVEKASYWYLGRDNEPKEMKLPDLEKAHEDVLKVAKKVKLARQLQSFQCKCGSKGCRLCQPLEAIFRGEGKFIKTDEIGRDIYVLPDGWKTSDEEMDTLL